MPNPGGESDKLGNQYEGVWTIARILDLAAGRVESLIVEPVSGEGIGIEFVLKDNEGALEFHSAKRQRAKGEWSLAALTTKDNRTSRSVLGDLFVKLANYEAARVCFVSSTGANDLRELAERAARRKTLPDFEADLNTQSHGRSGSSALRQSFEKHLLPMAPDLQAAHDYLQRMTVVLIDQATLTRLVEQHIASLVYRPDGRAFLPAEVRVLLGDFVLANLGTAIRAEAVWEYLNGFAYFNRDWAVDVAVRDVVRKGNFAYVHAVETDLVNGMRIPRDESQKMIDELNRSDGAKSLLLSAAAGVGKSCVLAQAVEALDNDHVPVLIVRLDRHGDARSPQDVGSQMDLPQSPVVILAGISHGGKCVLMLDQLDAVSQLSGRYPHLWETFDALCREVEAYPNMRLVIACRDFDLQHDHRLRRLKHSEMVRPIPVQPLSVDAVDSILSNANVDPSKIAPRQKQILQTPLHLFLFLDGPPEDRAETGFQSIGDLFERYWQHKQRAVATRLGRESDWIKVIDRICDSMSQSQTLTVPLTTIDEWAATAVAMQTEHVLVVDGKQLRFFHESFFDYAFARRFCATGQTLLAMLLSSEQHLFRRSQVRQVLSFLRDTDRVRYLAQLQQLLTSPRVRFHIKRMVIAWLGVLPDPSEAEWVILEPLIMSIDGQRHILPAIRHNLAWFDLLQTNGVIAHWLAGADSAIVNRGLWLMTWDEAQKCRSEQIAALLEPFCGSGPEWNRRLRACFSWGNAHCSRRMQELFLRLLDTGVLEEAGNDRHDDWWSCLRESAQHAPLFVIEAIAHWMDRMCDAFADSGPESVLDRMDYNQAAEHLIPEAVRREPGRYAAEILPRVLRIVEIENFSTETGLMRDRTWGFRSNHDGAETADAILNGLDSALRHLAVVAPEQLGSMIDKLTDTDRDTVAFLLLRSWSANPERFGDRCIHFLTSDPRRLDVGYGSWSGEGTGYAATSREAIISCLPFATIEHRQELEAAILNFPARAETDDFSGWTERLLLEAFGESNLSEKGRLRLEELRRKFPKQDTAIPKRGTGLMRCIGSPIPPDEARRLTDEEWLAAMQKYDYGWDSRRDHELQGSAVELSRILQSEARRDRRRFAALANRMDDSIRQEYFEAILDGVCGACNLSKEERERDDKEFDRLETEIVVELIRRFHRLPNRPCGRSICRAFSKLADRSIAESDIEILTHYATEDPDPPGDDWLQYGTQKGKDASESAHIYGYNSVRGQVARAIESLLFADYGRAAQLLPTIRKMLHDRSMAVRTCVIEALLPALNHDRDDAVRMFQELTLGAELIYGSPPFEDFIRYAIGTHYSQLRDVLQMGLYSASPSAVAASARQICLAGFVDEVAAKDTEAVRRGSEPMRCAAAEVYSFNIADATVGEICREQLRAHFADESKEVRTKAGDCFMHFTDADFGPLVELVRAYIESPSFPSERDDLLRKLEESTWQLPDITIRLAQRFVAAHGAAAGDIATAAAGDAPTVAKLVVRLYAQSNDDDLCSKCLDLIDEMERLGFLGIDAQLAEHDR